MPELLLIIAEQGVLGTLATWFGLHHTLRHGWDGGAAVTESSVLYEVMNPSFLKINEDFISAQPVTGQSYGFYCCTASAVGRGICVVAQPFLRNLKRER